MRLAPIGAASGVLLDFSASENYPTTGPEAGTAGSSFTPGTYINAAPMDAQDTTANTPNWGISELLYITSTSASTFAPGRLVHIDSGFNILDMPNTANTGRPLYVCLTAFSAGNTTRQAGWVLRAGVAPVSYSVAATAGAVYFAAAGQATPTLTAGKQILNATCLIAAASAFTRSVTSQNGSKFIKCSRVNGLFIGQTISGAGISGTVASIDPGGTGFVSSAASTGSATVTATFTPTGFGICHIDRPFVQGNIT